MKPFFVCILMKIEITNKIIKCFLENLKVCNKHILLGLSGSCIILYVFGLDNLSKNQNQENDLYSKNDPEKVSAGLRNIF